MDKIQAFRDSVRPILTLMLASSFCLCIMASLGACLIMMLKAGKFELEAVVALIAIIGTPFGMLMTYHFMKPSKKDST